MNDRPSAPRVAPSPAGAELERCLADASYTPPRRALRELVAALEELGEAPAKLVERALTRAGEPAIEAALEAFEASVSAPSPALLRLCERLANDSRDPRLFAPLATALTDTRPLCRKLAARALGKLHDARAEAPLLAALARADGPERKSMVDALGVVGGTAALGALEPPALPVGADPDLARRVARSRLLIERRGVRSAPAQIELEAPLGTQQTIELSCRSGLSEVLRSELPPSLSAKLQSPSAVMLMHGGTLAELLVARTALELAVVVPIDAGAAADAAERIAAALTRPHVLSVFARWTRGVPRFRMSWTGAGHRRALSWALAAAVRRRTTALVNDSRHALWLVRAAPDGMGELRLVPRLEPDPRFSHRVGAVRAASHPTIAAALARIAGAEPGDVVWDPFVGSGLELVERVRLGAVRAVWGSDIDAAALEVARSNLEAAGVLDAQLVQADALAWAPPDVSLILTNPPMGRRLARDGSLEALLTGFVRHAARVLRPGGRLVWLSPLAAKTESTAREAGLAVKAGPDVDMGGFSARVQVLTRRA